MEREKGEEQYNGREVYLMGTRRGGGEGEWRQMELSVGRCE